MKIKETVIYNFNPSQLMNEMITHGLDVSVTYDSLVNGIAPTTKVYFDESIEYQTIAVIDNHVPVEESGKNRKPLGDTD
ncbi:hypothetical protein [Paenibacillus bouchesdurhonensis]|uniref:hypothetical protein n=1 Tax=Paenibacillus bouchesdurhonensis TaxID=1870990 RepID=UPI000DA625A6|nr:hypothetical protein [Paenibacillus bouchesdurhonensis]